MKGRFTRLINKESEVAGKHCHRQVARGLNARISAFEEFSEFRPEGGLNLPHIYKFELSIQSEVRPALVDWTFDFTDFNFSEVLEFK